MGRWWSLFAAAGASAVLAGCGGSSSPGVSTGAARSTASPTVGRPITDEEALQLARVLNRNYEDGGAMFSGTLPFPRGTTVKVTGRIDWRHLRGQATFVDPVAKLSDRVYWTKTAVFEQTGPSGVAARTFNRHPPQPKTRVIDFYISALARTSSETIDNITTIKEQGTTFLRTDRLGVDAVNVFRYGSAGKARYWLDTSGLLRRIELDLQSLSGTAVLSFFKRGPTVIALPPITKTAIASR